jgi:hypothetical protein
MYYLVYYFIYLLRIACFQLLSLDVADLNELEDQDFEQLAGNLGKLSLTMLNLCSFSL